MSARRLGLLLIAPTLVAAACSLLPHEQPPPRVVTPRAVQVGDASWYGEEFHGNQTASGERFDQHDFTAASRSFPLGTGILVTNLANGRSVVVRINDRGPFARGRVLDLSRAAARELGMVERGTARVRIEALDEGLPEASAVGAR